MTQHYVSRPRTGERLVLERVTCNACGQDVPKKDYAVHVHADGGYDSDALSDCVSYDFDLCELCLVKLMDGLKAPPDVTDRAHDCMGVPPLTYAEDRRRTLGYQATVLEKREQIAHAAEHGLCSWSHQIARGERGGLCLRPAEGVIRDRPACLRCIRGSLGDGVSEIEFGPDGKSHPATLGGSALRDLLELRERPTFIYELRESSFRALRRELAIATALVLLGQEPELALRLLMELVQSAPEAVSEMVMRRRPWTRAELQLVPEVSAWLAWGRKQGYLQAIAAWELGYSVEQFWTVEDR